VLTLLEHLNYMGTINGNTIQYKLVNGFQVEMKENDINEIKSFRDEWEAGALALSDQTMSAEMTAYRQALRDITNGLTTVADVEAVVFPEKPGA
jgi:hypothetical protein